MKVIKEVRTIDSSILKGYRRESKRDCGISIGYVTHEERIPTARRRETPVNEREGKKTQHCVEVSKRWCSPLK